MKVVFVLSGTGAFHLKSAFEKQGGTMGLLSFYNVKNWPREKMRTYLMEGIDGLRAISREVPRRINR